MKIKNLAIIILMTTFFIILGTKAYAATGTIKEDAAKLRKQPDSKVVLDLLEKDSEVEILEEVNGWYKVKATTGLGKVTGYVSEDVITVENEKTDIEQPVEEPTNEVPVEKPVEEPAETPDTTETVVPVVTAKNIEEDGQYTLAKEISIKAMPLINSKEKAKISGNVTVAEIINEWVKVENDINSGWIRKNILKNSVVLGETPTQDATDIQQPEITIENPEQEQPAEPEVTEPVNTEPVQEPSETEINKTGYVSADGLRVRKGPSTDTEEITSLSKNHKVKIIGQSGKWYKIELDGEIGYISAKYVSDTKLPETTSRGGNTLGSETTEPKQEEVQKEEQTPVEATKPEPVTPEPSTPSTNGNAVVELAKQYLGYKYVSGGASPKGFDCSGFTQYVYKQFGVSLYRSSGDQIKNGVAVAKNDLQPGDLVIFNNDANTRIGHVGIYIGDGNFIHASNPSDGVKITTLLSGYYAQRYVGARRVI